MNDLNRLTWIHGKRFGWHSNFAEPNPKSAVRPILFYLFIPCLKILTDSLRRYSPVLFRKAPDFGK